MGPGIPFREMRALPVLPFLADIETFHRSVVSHYPGIYQAFAALLLILLQNQVMLLFGIHSKIFVFNGLMEPTFSSPFAQGVDMVGFIAY